MLNKEEKKRKDYGRFNFLYSDTPGKKAVAASTLIPVAAMQLDSSIGMLRNKKTLFERALKLKHGNAPIAELVGLGLLGTGALAMKHLDNKKKNLEKIAGAIGAIARSITEPAKAMGASHVRELGALGALAVPSAYNAVGDEKKKMGRKTTAALEVGGLGALAAPYAYKLLKGH